MHDPRRGPKGPAPPKPGPVRPGTPLARMLEAITQAVAARIHANKRD